MSNQDKITAYFGADVSEVEAKMLTATRATKAYEKAVQGVSKADAGSGLARNLEKTNGLFGEISKKFTGGKILESVLGGVGLGGGFAIAEKAAAMISKHWEDAAKSAESIAKSSDEATDYVLKRIGLRETEEQALTKAQARSKRADVALMAGSDDPEQREKLNVEAQKAAYELEVLQKKARERKAEADKKIADEARQRQERDVQLQLDAFERVKQQQDREADAAKKNAEELARAKEKAAEDQKRRDEEEQKREQELNDLIYERTWNAATDEQKLAQVIKEGRLAQKRADADASAENLIALEKVRKKYIDLMDSINGKKGAGGGADGGDGSRMRGGVKVSAEDAARSDLTSARNARLNQETQRGKIRDSGRVGEAPLKKTETILESIDRKLTPKNL
jgi:hypothetical protein